MNTLVYADIREEDTSNASSIASTMQQMALSFGVAIAGLTTAFFLPTHAGSSPTAFIHGIHKAFFALGGLTVVSTLIFSGLRSGDGESVSKHRVLGSR
jgi:hypothetical protein